MQPVFRRIDEPDSSWVQVEINGNRERVRAGESVAGAMLACGVRSCRTTPVSGVRRAPYCMMGVCFDCLVEINGVPNRQSCQVTVEEGMQIRHQQAVSTEYS